MSLLSEVHLIQNKLSILTGVTLKLTTLDTLQISSTTGVISLETSEVTVAVTLTQAEKVLIANMYNIEILFPIIYTISSQETALQIQKTNLMKVISVISVTELILDGSLSSGSGEETSVTDIITALITVAIKVSIDTFDTEFEYAITLLTGDFVIAVLSEEENLLITQIG